jgi:hypothetical protein
MRHRESAREWQSECVAPAENHDFNLWRIFFAVAIVIDFSTESGESAQKLSAPVDQRPKKLEPSV